MIICCYLEYDFAFFLLLAHYKKNSMRSKMLTVGVSIVSVAVMFCIAAFAFCLLRRIKRGNGISLHPKKKKGKFNFLIVHILILPIKKSA